MHTMLEKILFLPYLITFHAVQSIYRQPRSAVWVSDNWDEFPFTIFVSVRTIWNK